MLADKYKYLYHNNFDMCFFLQFNNYDCHNGFIVNITFVLQLR